MRVLTGGTYTKSLTKGHHVSRGRLSGIQHHSGTSLVITCDPLTQGADPITVGADPIEICPAAIRTCQDITLGTDPITVGTENIEVCGDYVEPVLCDHIVLGSGNPLVLTSEATDGVLTFCGADYTPIDVNTLTYGGVATPLNLGTFSLVIGGVTITI